MNPPGAVFSSRRNRALFNAAAGVAILAGVVAVAGGEPFLRGLTSVTPGTIAAAAMLTAIATWAAAWRWRLISAGLGLPLGQPRAVAAYYRSQFLNTVLPGGVVGDVHRALTQGARGTQGTMGTQATEGTEGTEGRAKGRTADASRAVVSERAAGQAVQLALAAVVLTGLGVSAYSSAVGAVFLALVTACAVVALVTALDRRIRRIAARELSRARAAFAPRGTVLRVVVASALVVSCHVATFVVACLAVGVEAPPSRVLAVSLIVVLATSLPFAVGGWGLREGAAAWAFGAAGLGSAGGIAASTAYGVLATIALAPGAAVIGASVLRARHDRRSRHAAPADRSAGARDAVVNPVTLVAREESTT